jgi:hypothetical protein
LHQSSEKTRFQNATLYRYIAGELFYDLEYQANPDVSDIGDALYW